MLRLYTVYLLLLYSLVLLYTVHISAHSFNAFPFFFFFGGGDGGGGGANKL